MNCRICNGANLEMFLSLGRQPHCNSFISKEGFHKEEFYPLDVYFCHNCKLVQIGYTVPAEKMFRHYLYVSGTTATLPQHFKESASRICKRFSLGPKDMVVDIGSNDGTFLKAFRENNVRTLGVEPATNIADMANQNGIETINDFFSSKTAERIVNSKGKASAITAAGVFFHLENLHDVVKGVVELLSDDGVFVVQAIYLGDMLSKKSFDNIYHEHLCYYTLHSLQYLFNIYEMTIFDVGHLDIHGGSLEVFVCKKGARKKMASVENLLKEESIKELDSISVYYDFAKEVKKIRTSLLEILNKAHSGENTIYTYGAPAKGNTLLNYCSIDSRLIKYAVEKNPLKCGLFTPGTHIPIVLEESVPPPDYYLILPWNFLNEFVAKEREYLKAGGKFIVPIPNPRIIKE